jgi:hypothetical protein
MVNMTQKIQTIDIHGKAYVPVAERLKLANNDLLEILTEIITNDDKEVLVKATIKTKKGTFVGHASSNKQSSGIEGQSSVEVAETSAIGRALGFAGYGVLDVIASAEEIKKTSVQPTKNPRKCIICGAIDSHKPSCPNNKV